MGLFDFFKKKDGDAPPSKAKWENLERPARVEKIVLPLFERIAAREGVLDAKVRKGKDGDEAILTGTLDGMPCRLHMSWSGGFDIEVRYDEELPFLDLDFEPDAISDPDSWQDKERRIAVAPGVFVTDDMKERKALEALPAELRTRIVEGMTKHRVRYFRSRPGETTIDLYGELPDLAAPEASLASLLRLAVDTAKVRGATPSPPPGAPVDPKQPFAGWKHLSQEEKWRRAVAFAENLAPRVHGEVRADREEREIEVRWTEGGVPLRVYLELGFLHVKPGALATGVPGTLDIFWDPTLTVREDLPEGAEWTEDAIVFLAKSIVVRGEEAEVRRQMALVREIPEPVKDELFAAMERHQLGWLNLEDGLLDVNLPAWPKTDDGTTAIEVARILGKVAAALPRTKSEPLADRVVRCTFCRALWFPTETRATCTHCGAPPQASLLVDRR